MAVSQPKPSVTRADVERIAKRDFPADPFAQVMATLDEYGQEKWMRESPRVQLAVLKLANGDVSALRQCINVAKIDHRDVLAPAEFPAYTKIELRNKLSDEEKKRIFDLDWNQYETWLRR